MYSGRQVHSLGTAVLLADSRALNLCDTLVRLGRDQVPSHRTVGKAPTQSRLSFNGWENFEPGVSESASLRIPALYSPPVPRAAGRRQSNYQQSPCIISSADPPPLLASPLTLVASHSSFTQREPFKALSPNPPSTKRLYFSTADNRGGSPKEYRVNLERERERERERGGRERATPTYCYLERHALYTEGCLFLTQLSQGNLVTRNRVKLNSSYPLCHPDALSSLSYSPISFCPFSQILQMCSALKGPEIPMLCF